MTFDESFWKSRHKDFQEWPCPNCSGLLVENLEQRQLVESQKSVFEKECPDWEPEWINGKFCSFLHCNNHECGELVTVTGDWLPNIFQSDQYDPEGEWVQIDYLLPKFVFPSVNLFPVPINLPEAVKVHLNRSFSAYWADKANCLNALRSSLEAVLTDQKIPRKFKSKKTGKLTSAKLHQRIERFKQKNDEIGELLMAVKWLGNQGSHDWSEESDLEEQVTKALKIIAFAFSELYNPTRKKTLQLARKINKKRG